MCLETKPIQTPARRGANQIILSREHTMSAQSMLVCLVTCSLIAAVNASARSISKQKTDAVTVLARSESDTDFEKPVDVFEATRVRQRISQTTAWLLRKSRSVVAYGTSVVSRVVQFFWGRTEREPQKCLADSTIIAGPLENGQLLHLHADCQRVQHVFPVGINGYTLCPY